jgi:hypothetical protein
MPQAQQSEESAKSVRGGAILERKAALTEPHPR